MKKSIFEDIDTIAKEAIDSINERYDVVVKKAKVDLELALSKIRLAKNESLEQKAVPVKEALENYQDLILRLKKSRDKGIKSIRKSQNKYASSALAKARKLYEELKRSKK